MVCPHRLSLQASRLIGGGSHGDLLDAEQGVHEEREGTLAARLVMKFAWTYLGMELVASSNGTVVQIMSVWDGFVDRQGRCDKEDEPSWEEEA
ncbi:hypothetical protein ZWY2020_012227 [Hordeum vulgare]|nr:hypothetical protein ZWY2020_012227 [Hordeum vulgare]